MVVPSDYGDGGVRHPYRIDLPVWNQDDAS